MLRNMTDDRRLTGGKSAPSPPGHGVLSGGLVSQESSWIGLLSVLSRPAMSFLHKYLPGRAQSPGPAEGGPRWTGAGFQNHLIDEERDFLKRLDHVMPLSPHAAEHLTYLRCQHDQSAGLLEPGPGFAAPWITAASLRDIGIEDVEDVDLCSQTQVGYQSPVRTLLSHVLMNPVSPQEVRPRPDWMSGSKGGTWWGHLLGGQDTSHRVLFSDPSWIEDETNQVSPQQLGSDPCVERTPAIVQSGRDEGPTLGENAGAMEHKGEPTDNGGLHTEQDTEGSTSGLSSSGGSTTIACSEAPCLTPDQDHGYSSLEEGQSHLLKTTSEEPPGNCAAVMEDECEETSENTDGDDESADLVQSVSVPECQNKAIAFIMGCPCSDDDSSQSESSDDDDDGFDSEGSSHLSDSSDDDDDDDDEEEEDSDSEADSESERLWNSLCQTMDPYNPRNFSAQQHSTPPKTIPTAAATPPSSAHSTPDSSPNLTSSPLSNPDVWDDSTSASEADEAESARLWSSFSSPDPYSPFSFQASIRTREPNKATPKTRAKRVTQAPQLKTASPPQYRKEEAEERQDSGFSELGVSTSSTSSSTPTSSAATKKVRFCDHVEEILLSSEEDRRGPWEQLARDRCRFLRRCQEVEQSIAFCLQPQHRSLVLGRLTIVHVRSAAVLHVQKEDVLQYASN